MKYRLQQLAACFPAAFFAVATLTLFLSHAQAESPVSDDSPEAGDTIQSCPAFQRGVQHVERGEFAEAAPCFDDALVQFPNSPQALSYAGGVYAHLNKPERAAQFYRRHLAVEPNSIKAHANLGAVLQMAARYEESISPFRCVVELDPANLPVRLALAAALYETRRYDDALEAYSACLDIDPSSGVAASWRAATLLEIGRYDDAIAQAKDAMRLDDAQVFACLVTIGHANSRLDRPHLAEAAFRQAITARPGELAPRTYCAYVLLGLGKYDDVLEVLQGCALHADGNEATAECLALRGMAQAHLGHNRLALVDLKAALEHSPDIRGVRLYQSLLLYNQGRHGDAIACLEKEANSSPSTVNRLHALSSLAAILASCPDVRLQDHAKAVELAEAAIDLAGDDNLDVLRNCAAAFAACGKFDEAVLHQKAVVVGLSLAHSQATANQDARANKDGTQTLEQRSEELAAAEMALLLYASGEKPVASKLDLPVAFLWQSSPQADQPRF